MAKALLVLPDVGNLEILRNPWMRGIALGNNEMKSVMATEESESVMISANPPDNDVLADPEVSSLSVFKGASSSNTASFSVNSDGTIQKCSPEARLVNIEKRVGLFLAQAPDRDGGRKIRELKAINTNLVS